MDSHCHCSGSNCIQSLSFAKSMPLNTYHSSETVTFFFGFGPSDGKPFTFSSASGMAASSGLLTGLSTPFSLGCRNGRRL